MELRHLRYFVEVAEQASFSRAAEVLGISQSPLSAQIKSLEGELGALLFNRTTRSVEMTSAGEALLARARDLLAASDRAIAATRSAARGEMGTVVAGFGSMQLLDVFAVFAKTLAARHPDLHLDLRRINSPQVHETLLRDRVIDVSHFGHRTQSDEFTSEVMASYPLGAVVSESHPLARQGSAALAQFADDWFIGHTSLVHAPPDSSLAYLMWRACTDAGFQPRIARYEDDLAVHMALAGAGVGVALMPMMFRRVRVAGAVWIRLTDTHISVPLWVTYRRQAMDAALANYLAVAREVFAAEQSHADDADADYAA